MKLITLETPVQFEEDGDVTITVVIGEGQIRSGNLKLEVIKRGKFYISCKSGPRVFPLLVVRSSGSYLGRVQQRQQYRSEPRTNFYDFFRHIGDQF